MMCEGKSFPSERKIFTITMPKREYEREWEKEIRQTNHKLPHRRSIAAACLFSSPRLLLTPRAYTHSWSFFSKTNLCALENARKNYFKTPRTRSKFHHWSVLLCEEKRTRKSFSKRIFHVLGFAIENRLRNSSYLRNSLETESTKNNWKRKLFLLLC